MSRAAIGSQHSVRDRVLLSSGKSVVGATVRAAGTPEAYNQNIGGSMSSRLLMLAVTSCGLVACSPANEETATTSVPSGEWRTLFDGRSLDGWTQVGDANWQLGDGAVRADSGTGFLLSNEVYDDFDLELEFYVTPDANSGVFIRCVNPAEIGAATCYEVNIFDQRPDPSYRTGGIVDVARPSVMLDTGDRWNTYEISARGRHLTVRLNGQTTVDTNDDKFAAGPFALQYGAGQVMFRNVRIRN